MHDYQLERLNTRSFEQLIQALGLEIIGKQLMVFGDGPDGGREAIFEGPTKYPEGEQQWDGYGIVQAKFRQQPHSLAKKNADWVIAQLKSEFRNFKPRSERKKGAAPGERICPEYYIFATNLALSPVAKTGGKDRVRATLDGFKKSHGLKDYALWDGDQIRRFLDAQPAIRTTYAAWVLPGDALTAVMRHLKLEDTDFHSTMRHYLESELLDDQYAKLSQGGYTDSNAIPLSRVFVDLPVKRPSVWDFEEGDGNSDRDGTRRRKAKSTSKKSLTFLELLFEEGREVLRPSANIHHTAERLRSQSMAGRVVLIGGPGQGKTTAGQFACQLLRAALLKAAGANHSPEVTQALALIEQQSQELPKSHALRYPLRVDLKRFAEALAGEGGLAANSLLEYLVRHISARTDSELSKKEFRVWLRSYPWLLVLDGLDEVPVSSNRAKMMAAIRDFVSVEAHQQDADLLVLATTRPQGYSDEFDPGLYLHLTLAPLNAAEALQYGARLAEARHPGLKSRIEDLLKSLKRATSNASTVRLMESPLQVTIMLALIEGGGEPPEQRWKLFHDYYDVIYRREKERGTSFSALLGRYEPDIHWLHHRAGWILQQRNATTGTTAARLTHIEFEKIVDIRLLKRGHSDPTQRGILVKQIREAATDRLVFLVGNTAKEIGFEIRSLQEFMAAEHCFDGSEACTQETIRTIAPHPYWRNVFLFAAGRIFFEKESLIDSLIAVCARLNEPLTDQAQGYILAGSRLALSMLIDGVARNQPENSRALARCAARLLDSQDPSEAKGLVGLFKSEACDVWVEELSKRLLENRVKFPHLAWRLCIELVGADSEWADQFVRTHFPWHHAEAPKFIAETIGDVRSAPNNFKNLLKERIFFFSPTVWEPLFWAGRAGEVEDALEWEPLRQLAHLYSPPLGDDATELLDEAGRPTRNALMYKGSTANKPWAELKMASADMENAHPTWRAYHAVAEFAREPTPASLAKQFSVIAESDPSLELLESGVYSLLPWQIYACLVARKLNMPMSQIVSAIASGVLGTVEDWARWDALSKKGIKISSLGFSSEVFLVSDHCQGIVYDNAVWLHRGGGSRGEFDFAVALVNALPHLLSDSRIAKALVHLCCFGLGRADPEWSPNDAVVIERLVVSCGDMKIPMDRQVIAATVRSFLAIEEKIKLLSHVGIGIVSSSWTIEWSRHREAVNKSCARIAAAMSRSERWFGVLRAFSFLPPLPFMRALPASTLEECRHHDERGRQAAIVLQANSLEWDRTGEEIAADVWGLRAQYPMHLEELLDFIDSQGASGAHIESFLLALMRMETPELKPKLRAGIASLLVKLVERRPVIDSLPDPSTPRLSNVEL